MTPHLRSIDPSVQRHMAFFAMSSKPLVRLRMGTVLQLGQLDTECLHRYADARLKTLTRSVAPLAGRSLPVPRAWPPRPQSPNDIDIRLVMRKPVTGKRPGPPGMEFPPNNLSLPNTHLVLFCFSMCMYIHLATRPFPSCEPPPCSCSRRPHSIQWTPSSTNFHSSS